MKKINLKQIYPHLYDFDFFCEVSDEIAELLETFRKEEEAYQRRMRYHKEYFNIDCVLVRKMYVQGEIIEEDYERKLSRIELYESLDELSEKQKSRIYFYYIVGMTKKEIADKEGVVESAIRKSIQQGVEKLKKVLEKGCGISVDFS